MTVGCQQKVLARLGVKFQPVYQRYVAPSDIAIRKAIAIVDGVVLDEAAEEWFFAMVRGGHLEER